MNEMVMRWCYIAPMLTWWSGCGGHDTPDIQPVQTLMKMVDGSGHGGNGTPAISRH